MAINEKELMNLSDEELDVISQNTMTIKMNRMQQKIKIMENRMNMFEANQQMFATKTESNENHIKNLTESQEELKTEVKQVKDVTYILATDGGKRRSLTKLVNNLCYRKYTDKKHSLKDKLFHKAITNGCYNFLYNQFQVNSYTSIKIDDFDEAIKVINRWYNNDQNIKKIVSKRLQEYINDEYLPESKKQMVDKLLEMTNGGTNLW